jgi:hypothetical protein
MVVDNTQNKKHGIGNSTFEFCMSMGVLMCGGRRSSLVDREEKKKKGRHRRPLLPLHRKRVDEGAQAHGSPLCPQFWGARRRGRCNQRVRIVDNTRVPNRCRHVIINIPLPGAWRLLDGWPCNCECRRKLRRLCTHTENKRQRIPGTAIIGAVGWQCEHGAGRRVFAIITVEIRLPTHIFKRFFLTGFFWFLVFGFFFLVFFFFGF